MSSLEIRIRILKRQPNLIRTAEITNKSKQIREIPLLVSDLCSHFDFNNFEFQENQNMSRFISDLSEQFPNTVYYYFGISSFENGYGYFFDDKDYTKLATDLLNVLAIYSVCKNKLVT